MSDVDDQAPDETADEDAAEKKARSVLDRLAAMIEQRDGPGMVIIRHIDIDEDDDEHEDGDIEVEELTSPSEVIRQRMAEQAMNDPETIDWNNLTITVIVEGGNDHARSHLTNCPVHQEQAAHAISRMLYEGMATADGGKFIGAVKITKGRVTADVIEGGRNIGVTKSA